MDYNGYLDEYYNKYKIDFDKIGEINIEKISSFIYIINHWSQILGLVIFKCKDHKKRKNLVKNLYDENNGDLTHVDTFYMFLKELGFSGNIDEIKLEIYTELYIQNITNIIMDNDFDDCCQILGSIEYIYQKISTEIIKWFRQKFNRTPEYHFTLHESLDKEHSKELFELNNKYINNYMLTIGADWILETLKSLILLS